MFWLFAGMLALLFIGLSTKNILIDVYAWHMEQPETTQGLLEILMILLICILVVGVIKNRKVKSIGVLLVFLLYLQNHQALVPFFIACIYIEMIMAVGHTAKNLLKIPCEKSMLSYLMNFVVGVTFWGGCAIVISLIGIGNFNHLRILTVVLFVSAVIANRGTPFFIAVKNAFEKSEKMEQVTICLLGILVLIQCAKGSRAFDFDSLWYGLRPEQVLIGENSFYDNLGMLAWVNYFPKLVELIFAPLSNLGEYSFIYAGNNVIYVLFIVAVYIFLREVKVSKKPSLCYTILICSTPCIANMASTAKSDLMTSLFVVLAGLFFYMYSVRNDDMYIFFALTALCLALGGKVNNYLYAFVAFVGGVLLILNQNRENKKAFSQFLKELFQKKNIRLFVLIFLGLFVLGGVTYRTYLLTGYPLYPFTVNIWEKLGFEGVYPFADYFGGRAAGFKQGTVFNFEFYLKHIYNLLFNPIGIWEYRESYIVSNWYGNFTVYFAIIILVLLSMGYKRKLWRTNAKICILAILTILTAVFVAVFKFQYGQDGNYYIVPVTISIICFSALLNNVNIESFEKKYWYIICSTFIALNFAIMFVSHFSWSWGTDKLENRLTESFYDSEEIRINNLVSEDLLELEKYIVSKDYETPRTIGLGYTQKLFQLSGGYEDIKFTRLTTKGIFDTEENLLYYLRWAEINYIILPQDNGKVTDYEDDVWKETYSPVWNVYNMLLQEDDVVEIQTEKYRMIDITAYFEG